MPPVVRYLVLSGIGIWGWYACSTFRTSSWGYDNLSGELLTSLQILCCIALPLTFIPLIGIPWRKKFVTIALFTLVCLVSVETFARAQEYLIIRKLGANPPQHYVEQRWGPFKHHCLGYVQGRWWGCD
jgi:hypothetical protein